MPPVPMIVRAERHACLSDLKGSSVQREEVGLVMTMQIHTESTPLC